MTTFETSGAESATLPRLSGLDLLAALERHPGSAVAIVDADGATCYAELRARARALATQLAHLGVGPGSRVGVCLGRRRSSIEALVGVLLAGAAYVPLDPAYPAGRREQMLGRARAQVVLVDADDPGGWRIDRTVIDVATVQGADDVLLTRPRPSDLAYVLFTSGSTGTPKGVEVSHANLSSLLGWAASTLSTADLAHTLAGTSFTFDPSVLEIFGTLAVGGCLHLATNALDLLRAGNGSAHLTGVTFLSAVPSVLSELAGAGRLPGSLRALMTGGETLPEPVATRLLDQVRHARLLHAYGPTETTVLVTCQELRHRDGQTIHLGQTLPGTEIWLLDGDRPVPVGSRGELCVAGRQVSRGYADAPGLTADRFVSWPRPDGTLVRLYRTGDLASRDEHGRLHLHGRLDRQVKVRGFRVEPDEIEAHLQRDRRVAAAAVLVSGSGATARLVGFVSARDATTDHDHLRASLLEALRSSLPAHLVPSELIVLPVLPRKDSGKVDHDHLLSLLTAEPKPLTSVSDARLRGPLEQHVAEIVAELLDLTGLPDRDSDVLDELGLTSLGLLHLLARLEGATGVRPSIDAVLADASVAGIARLAAGGSTPGAVWLNRDAPGEPIVLLHVYVGGLLKYRALTEHLPGRPLLLVDPLAGGGRLDGLTLADLARRSARIITGALPEGPYHLAGHSAGGLLAMEVAGHLLAADHGVDTLVLIDTPALRNRISYYWGEGVLHLPEFVAGSWSQRLAKLQIIAAKRVRRLRTADRVPGLLTDVLERENASTAAVLTATPRRYDDPVTILTTRQGRVMSMGSRTLGWRRFLTGAVEVRRVRGLHTGIFDPEHVAGTAAELDRATGARS